MNEAFIPCWVIIDGSNRPFDTWISPDEVAKINAVGGLSNAVYFQLRETEEKPIPDDFKNGISMCKDIWVVIAIGPAFNLSKN